MTPRKVRAVLALYRAKLEELGCNDPTFQWPLGQALPPDEPTALKHCYGMLDSMLKLVAEEEDMEKLLRWLGFVQGCLWCRGVCTIDELRAHNRSDPDEEEILCCSYYNSSEGGECLELATWVRFTQFAGNHPLCTKHAQEEGNFGKEDPSYFFWEELSVPGGNEKEREKVNR